MRALKMFAVSLVALLGWTLSVCAEVKLHGLFSDGMVLQQDMKVPVWGTADDGEKVTAKFLDQEVSATAAGGKWMVKLNELKAGGPFTMTISGKNTIGLKDVYVGEVWVCSGQSNMAWSVKASANADQEIANSANPMIRLFTVPGRAADEPMTDIKGQWQACGPDTVGNFSAVGYFFGRDIQKAINVPVGLINSSVGGTPAEAWTRKEAMAPQRGLRAVFSDYAKAQQELPQALEKYNQAMVKYNEMSEKMKTAGKTPPPPPRKPGLPPKPASLYNGMIAPLMPYGIAGVIWYQGESNANRPLQYRTLFPTLIEDWRTNWGEGQFPFLFVQLAPFLKIQPEPQLQSNWAELREAQLATLSLPKTGMAVITDAGNENDIHPKQKQIVGARLALAARAIAYGEKIEYSGPLYSTMKVEGSKVVLSFTHTGGGLEAKGGELKGFAIAGPDSKFVWAKTKIAGDDIVVWNPLVESPSYVRYGWADCPVCNLYNKEGLPASPFRTAFVDSEEQQK